MNNDEEKIIERDSGFTFACPECEYPPQHFTTKRHLDQHMNKSHCKHREDGMVHCVTCDEPGHPSMNMDDEDFEGCKD